MTNNRTKDVEVSQKKKDQCSARAQKIVLELIDGIESEEQFLEQLRWINQNHYQDIIEERAISRLCGYPVCEEKLSNVPKKRYQISVVQNKVFDITERKLFCSNRCYKASMYLKMQLHTSPLWLGNREKQEAFSLSMCKAELMGEEIAFGIEQLEIVPKDLESETETTHKANDNEAESFTYTVRDGEICSEDESDSEDDNSVVSNQENLDSLPCRSTPQTREDIHESVNENVLKCSNATKSVPQTDKAIPKSVFRSTKCSNATKSTPQTQGDIYKSVNESAPKCSNTTKSTPLIHQDIHESVFRSDPKCSNATESVFRSTPKCSNATNMNPTKSRERETSTQSVNDLVYHVQLSIREWMTVDSLRFIFGDVAVTDMFYEKGYELNSDCIKKYPFLSERDQIQCQQPQVQEEDLESSEPELPSEPLPDFETLKKQTEEIEAKVKAFFRGDKRVSFAENGKETTTTNDDYSRPIVLPVTVHHHTQNAIRRNIILNKLKFVLPDLCDKFALNRVDISSKVKELVLTCNLSAHNITFKPIESNLLGLVLLKLLSVQDHSIRTNLENKSDLVTAILKCYHLETNYLDISTKWITDLDFILRNETKS